MRLQYALSILVIALCAALRLTCNPFTKKGACEFLPLKTGNCWRYNYSSTDRGSGTALIEVAESHDDEFRLRVTITTDSTSSWDVWVTSSDGTLKRRVGDAYYSVIWNGIHSGSRPEVLLLNGPYSTPGENSCEGRRQIGGYGCTTIRNSYNYDYSSSTSRTVIMREVTEHFAPDVGLVGVSVDIYVAALVYIPEWGWCGSDSRTQRSYSLVEYHVEPE